MGSFTPPSIDTYQPHPPCAEFRGSSTGRSGQSLMLSSHIFPSLLSSGWVTSRSWGVRSTIASFSQDWLLGACYTRRRTRTHTWTHTSEHKHTHTRTYAHTHTHAHARAHTRARTHAPNTQHTPRQTNQQPSRGHNLLDWLVYWYYYNGQRYAHTLPIKVVCEEEEKETVCMTHQ